MSLTLDRATRLSIEWIEPEEASPYYDENQDQDFPTVRYYYDGQMGIEEDHTYNDNESMVCDVTKYGIGARGIDWMSFSYHGGGDVISFPIYDGHGNMLYTLKRESGNNFSLNNRKVYDVWGGLRNGSGGAEQEHCASLGHRTDNETDLVYMRARYYEPWTGRFINQDPAMDGLNWFVYCGNDPVNHCDFSGKFYQLLFSIFARFAIGFMSYSIVTLASGGEWTMRGALVAGLLSVLIPGVMFRFGPRFLMSIDEGIVMMTFLPSYQGIAAGIMRQCGVESKGSGWWGVFQGIVGCQIWLSFEIAEMER